MSTCKYGPIVVDDSSGWYGDTEKDTYEVEYQTTSDTLSVLRNGEVEISLAYYGSRAVARMITKWYLAYEKGLDNEEIDNLIGKE